MFYSGLTSKVAMVALLAAGISAQAQGAAFHLYERSVVANGRANAGAAAATDDVGIMAFNPAGITEFDGVSMAFGVIDLIPKGRITDQGSTMMVGPVGPLPVAGDPTGQGFGHTISGYLHIAAPVTDDLWVGVAVSAPFGLKPKYEEDFFGRYDSLETNLVVIETSPSVAYRVNEFVSLGAKLDVQYIDATISNALPNPLDPMGPNPASDGIFEAKGDDWTIGFTLGVHLRPTEDLDIGVSYRNGVKHVLTGNTLTSILGMDSVVPTRAPLHLPDVLSIGVDYQLTDTLRILAEADYFGFSNFDRIVVIFPDDSEAATIENYRNTWSFSLGAELETTSNLTLRAGVQHEQSPTRDALRSTRVPDPNRWWGTIGASYRLANNWQIDVSYARLFPKTGPVVRDSAFPDLGTTVATRATTKTSGHVFGVGVQTSF